ncbi:MAG: amidase [Dehalococcoidia bacterium]|nr:amidase [Dehalococcoidia bacterium]
MSEEICYADAVELAEKIRARHLSPVEVVQAHLDRIESINPKINAIVQMVPGALKRAREAEEAISRGEVWGPLHGVPFTVKDCVDTEGVTTTRGSKLFADHVPAADASVVKRLKDAGGIFIAKTNMPEFALWWETDNLVYGRTENPWMSGRTPGGSSGGEAIAAGLSPLGIGSDVGGSIREPANYCGIVGLKATHGRIPLTGHWPDVLLRFMHVGPMARSVRDVALGLSLMAGPDGLDSYTMPMPLPALPDSDDGVSGLRIGWFPEGPFAPVEPEVQRTITKASAALSELGCVVEPVSFPAWERLSGLAISGALFSAEGTQYLRPIFGGREDELAPSMKRRLALPAPTFDEYLEAVSNCDLLRQDLQRFFMDYDVLLCPVGPVPAHPHDSVELEINGHRVPGRKALGCTVPFDLTGSPAMSVPFGWSDDGLPIGVQIVGRHYDESTVIKVGYALEALHAPEGRRPPV